MDYDMDDPRWTEQDPELLKEFYKNHNILDEKEEFMRDWDIKPTGSSDDV